MIDVLSNCPYKDYTLKEGDKIWRYTITEDIEKYYSNGCDPKLDRGGYITTPNTHIVKDKHSVRV